MAERLDEEKVAMMVILWEMLMVDLMAKKTVAWWAMKLEKL